LSSLPYRNVAQDVNIDVKVYVNPLGKVDYSEVLSKVPETDRDLAALAVFSARQWEFVPARAVDGNVAGEVILQYEFGPAVRADRNHAGIIRGETIR
jgi:outer membrane biosynthesis protein TonB